MNAPLSLSKRLLGVLGAGVLAFLGSPGISWPEGSLFLALLGVALWAWTAAHPLGPHPARARAIEWLGGALAGGLLMWWVSYVVVFGVLYIGAGFGVYAVLQGALLRRLSARLSFPLAVGLAWSGAELLRAWIPPPFGLGWFRLGYYAHAHLWLSGSARLWGVEGLTLVLASVGGGLAALASERKPRLSSLASAGLPLVVAVLLARLLPAPATVDGPRVLLVQPGFTQARKQHDNAEANLSAARDLTHRAAAECGPVDLVAWGETMLYIPIFTPQAEAALRERGALPLGYGETLEADHVEGWREVEKRWVEGEILGRERVPSPFPAGASFAVGTECVDFLAGRLQRKVALVVYDAEGRRSPPAFKQALVPLGETFFGLERFAWVRRLAESAAGYLPDLVAGTQPGRLELHTPGRRYDLSGTICFDNAHPEIYARSLRAGPVDFHLVASNEAWYESSCEMDQMVAFSRLAALSTGRSVVRATNSGVSLVLAPDGRELGRVRGTGGSDRAVPGFGAWTVPVPPASAPARTPYVRLGGALRLALFASVLVALLGALAGGNRRPSAG